MRRPLLFVAAALACGCALGADLPAGAAWRLIGLGAALLALGSPAAVAWRVVALGGAALATGAAAASVETLEHGASPLLGWVEEACPQGPVRLEGLLLGDAREAVGSLLAVLEVDRAACAGRGTAAEARVRVEIGGERTRPELLDGDRVALWATLSPPRASGNPAGPDPAAQARRARIHAYGYCKSSSLVTVLERGAAGGARAWTAAARSWARRELLRLLPRGNEEGLVRAMVLGDRSGLDHESEEAFRAAGTYHVLAISGAQVAMLAALLAWPLRRAGAPPAATGLLVSASLLLYAQLVGGEVPVVRATCMAVVVLLGLTLDLPSDLANLVGLAAVGLLVHRPPVIGDVGFQLSFAATLGILLLTPPLLERAPRLPLRLDIALAASVSAQAALVPLLAYHFARVAPAALLLNVAAVPLSGAILLAGLTTLALAAVGAPLAGLAAELAWLAAHALLRTGDVVRLWPWLDLKVAPPAAWVWMLHLAGVWALVAGCRRRGAALLAASMLGLVAGPLSGRADGRLHACVLDVGQGDAIVVRSPNGKVMVIDAGNGRIGRSDDGERVVAPYLWSLGVRRLDRLVLSHAHPDHFGGAGFLARAFDVGEVWEGPAPLQDRSYSELDRALRAAAAARRTVTAGLRESWDGVELEVLGPPRPARAPWRTRNDDSLVLRLRLGSVSLLLPGDIEAAGEARLPPRHADVLKVPHHGSRTSTTAGFLAACSPRLALFSAGRRNAFGHPHPEVLERCRRQGSLVLRTDRDGALEVATDGSRLWLRTHRHGSAKIR